MDDFFITDLEIERYEVIHIHNGSWQILAQCAHGRLRSAKSQNRKDLFAILWMSALIDGSNLPSLGDESTNFHLDYQNNQHVYQTQEELREGLKNIKMHENGDILLAVFAKNREPFTLTFSNTALESLQEAKRFAIV